MNAAIILGIILILTGLSFGVWIFQCGCILVLAGVSVFAKGKPWDSKKIIERLTAGLMVLLFIWGFVTGAWSLHPLGAIIGFAGGIWCLYQITRI